LIHECRFLSGLLIAWNKEVAFGKTSFEKHMKKYETHGILPVEDDVGGRHGRPVVTRDILGMNSKQINNVSYVSGNDFAKTKEFLTQEKKRILEDQGYASEMVSEPSSPTVYNYMNNSVAKDARMSAGILADAQRKKIHLGRLHRCHIYVS
jgi:hypothetical protein